MKKKIYHLFLLVIYPIVDFIAVALAILSSYNLYRLLGIGRQVSYAKADFFVLTLLLASACVLSLLVFGAYKKESGILNVEEVRSVFKGITASFLMFAVMIVFLRWVPSRYVLVFSYILSVLFVVVERTLLYHMLPLFTSMRGLHKRILIYGAGELGRALYREMVNSHRIEVVPVGFIDDDPNKQGKVCYPSGYNCSNGISVLGTVKDIKKLHEKLDIDEVCVAISNIDLSTITNVLNFLKEQEIKVCFVPNLYKVYMHKMKIDKIGQIPIAREGGVFICPYLRIKRYIDLLLALLFLCLSWPLFVLIAVAIKIGSEGPVFFNHERVGKDDKIFQIYKFRSMFTDTDPYAVNPLDKNDPRITWIGRFLRKTSLDELPQAFNVIKGDMSFVGPRPEMPFIVEGYNEIHKERLKVLPGITGLWQLSGDRKKAIHENMDYDLYYIRNVSFSLDMAILIETLIFAFRGI
jgi:exopolysaccharide biosynthesis polyprenyl glycosylphosphotransferase